MEQDAVGAAIERLDVFIGEWRMETSIPGAPAGRAAFEFMPGRRFLIQRWGFPGMPGVDTGDEFGGIAIIGLGPGPRTYLQHYFDSRGVARVYQMSFSNGVWKLGRDSADFSPLDFSQRFTGTFSDDGRTIQALWEISYDGERWEHDFDLTYTKAT